MAIFNYNEQANLGGLYIIWNSHTWRTYVGSTMRFKTRWKDGHFKSLLNGKHQNKFLQADFNKCKEILGHDDFLEFHVIKSMPGSTKDQRLTEEEIWLKLAFDQGNQCYNLCDRAVSREGHKSANSKETSQKHSVAMKRTWQNPTYRQNQSEIQSIKTKEQWKNPEFRAAKIKGMTGKVGCHVWTEKEKARQSNHMKAASYAFKARSCKLVNPKGELVLIDNLTKYCREYKEDTLVRSGLSQLVAGTIKSYKGWTLPI